MKTLGVLVASALFAMLIAAPVYAQQPGSAHAPAPPSAGVAAAPGPGMMGGAMPMMDMCRQMMGGMMGMPMMGDASPLNVRRSG